MKLKILGITAAALLGLQSANASAHTDVVVGLDFVIPAPVVVERHPVYYGYEYEPAPVYFYGRYDRGYPRRYYRPGYEGRYYDRHDRRWHRRHDHHHDR